MESTVREVRVRDAKALWKENLFSILGWSDTRVPVSRSIFHRFLIVFLGSSRTVDAKCHSTSFACYITVPLSILSTQ